jgi:predicted ester cyclase
MEQDRLSRRAFAQAGALGAASLALGSQPAQAKGKPMSVHAANKRLLRDFLTGTAAGDERRTLERCCHADCRFEIFHPFNTIDGLDAVNERFFVPLRKSFPDYEQRIAFAIAGEYEGRSMVSSWGHVMGTFDAPWLGIPKTNGLVFLSFGFNAIVRDGKIAKAYILLDIVDVMRQAGHYPFRDSPGTMERWPFPPADTGATALSHDPVRGAETLRIVREMQTNLLKPDEIKELVGRYGPHHPNWHEHMNWYGPVGIGSMRGVRSYRNFHGTLFIQAFADRGGWKREKGGPQDAPGHYIRAGDGFYAVTAGYPSLRGTHTGPEWLGLPPTGRKIEFRVADWYRVDESGKIYDNWVMMDIPHIVQQMGMDLFHDLEHFVDREKPRYRLAP